MKETIYRKMYTTLFNAVTDSIEQMEQGNCGAARELLIKAQQETEETYISH